MDHNKELVEYNSYFKPVKWEDHCKWLIIFVQEKTLRYLQ